MISARARWIRFITSIILLAIFATLAFILWKKQHEKYSFQSFHVQNEYASILIPNSDKLKKKLHSSDELQLSNLPTNLEAGINSVIQNKNFTLEDYFGNECYFSYNENAFLIAFKTSEITTASLAQILTDDFQIDASSSSTSLAVHGMDYQVNQYGHYLIISSQIIKPVQSSEKENFGNADYIEFSQANQKGISHIINDHFHYSVWEDSINGPSGKPMLHNSFLAFVPSTFSQISFFGSTNFSSDVAVYFQNPEPAEFSWIDGGMLLIKKDSFELLIAPQNLEADLKMILEEQTLHTRGDTSFIPYFNIGNYEIMPFESTINWNESIQELDSDFSFYTHIDNFNVLSNSIPAMRWYLGEVQLGNLFLKNSLLKSIYTSALPQRAHQFQITHHAGMEYTLQSKIWNSQTNRIQTICKSGNADKGSDAVKLIADMEVDIIPTAIQTVHLSEEKLILLSNLNQISLYDSSGAKNWDLRLSSDLTSAPQLIDLENDGSEEIVCFQKDQIDLLGINGKSKTGFPKKYNGTSKGGVAVNYDNGYNYRFLVSVGNQIRSLDENGNQVVGWMFGSMSAELQGSISYYVTQGKDMISFKDITNTQYVINRRGESRLTKTIKVNIPNESTFVVGAYEESSLRKLGYRNNYIYNYYLMDGHKDSVKIDKNVMAISAKWIFNNNQPLLVLEETDRVVVLDEFGYEKESVLKPEPNQTFAGLVINRAFEYVFADNSQNALYLLDGFGKTIFPVPVSGSSVFHLKDGLLYTFVGTKIKVYKTE